jgi:hypothetical protein
LWSSLLVALMLGCSSRSLAPTGPGPTGDASTRPPDGGTHDAGGCGCQIGNDGVMRMSWSCFVASYGVNDSVSGWCGSPGGWSSACGLDVFTYENQYGLLNRYVYDGSGLQVGAHYENLDTPFACPDSLLQSLKVESGTLPSASCTAVPCACNFDRGDGSFTCPAAADASVWQDAASRSDAAAPTFDAASCDCHIDANGVLRMSYACFCSGYGCEQPELAWCGGDGQWTSACGLNVYTLLRYGGLPQTFVYDQNGTEVGVGYQNGATKYVCPVDPTLQADKIAGGTFPDSACAVVACTCNADGTFTCPTPDAGARVDAAADR